MILVDALTLDILLEHNAYISMNPSSMTKIATALFAFYLLQSKDIEWDTNYTVPQLAFRTEGSSMFLNIGQLVSVRDLLAGIITISGNDASRALAIGFAGSEENFAQLMTDFVKKIGAKNTNFVNASGLYDERHKTTAYDLFVITYYLMRHYPDYYKLFSQKEFTFNGITQKSKNRLLFSASTDKIVYDGVKTGYTEAGGRGMVASAILDNRRLILVINGLSTEKLRESEAKHLLTWGFRNTKNIIFYHEQQEVASLPVWFGTNHSVSVGSQKMVAMTLRTHEKKPEYVVQWYDQELIAPIRKGAVLGNLLLKTEKRQKSFDLVALHDVDLAPWYQRTYQMVGYYFSKLISKKNIKK